MCVVALVQKGTALCHCRDPSLLLCILKYQSYYSIRLLDRDVDWMLLVQIIVKLVIDEQLVLLFRRSLDW